MKTSERIKQTLIVLSQKTKTMFIAMSVYTLFLLIYDIIFFRKSLPEMGAMYLKTIIVCLVLWFGIKLMFFVLQKNYRCTTAVFNFFSLFFLFAFIFMTISSGILVLASGLQIFAIAYPIAVLSIIRVQAKRQDK